MKLIVSRSQQDTPAGVRFVLACRLEVSPEETDLLKRFAPTYRFGKLGTVWDLIGPGFTFADQKSARVRAREDKIRKGCQRLQASLERAQHYQGQEEVEF